jgi:hypothetical protein
MEKSSRAILGWVVGKSWGTDDHEGKWPRIQKFLRIFRHLRGGSQTPAGGLPPPSGATLKAGTAATWHELPLRGTEGKSLSSPFSHVGAAPGPSADGRFGPGPSAREGKTKVHSLHVSAQALRQASDHQRVVGPSARGRGRT